MKNKIKLSFIEKIQLALLKNFIFKIASSCGCDWDGDILNFYVNESKKIVEPYNAAQIQGLGGYDEK